MTTSTRMAALVAAITLFGCGDKAGDTGQDGAGDGGSVADGGGADGGGDTGTADCNTDNEDCGPGTCSGEGVNMLPGADCLACHQQGLMPGGEDEPNKWYTVAGTVFTDLQGTDGESGAIIRVTDSVGTTVEMTSSSAGNFYSRTALTPPLSAEVEVGGSVQAMATPVDTGACNSCHRCDGPAGGKLHP
ncbi:MAG: hypothetical protein D6798_02720 [Deltaproteobacteria bacterium]|nr:MAG: hypothetical protein D6798_02720 [Deltaproteobacteria bacterium]